MKNFVEAVVMLPVIAAGFIYESVMLSFTAGRALYHVLMK